MMMMMMMMDDDDDDDEDDDQGTDKDGDLFRHCPAWRGGDDDYDDASPRVHGDARRVVTMATRRKYLKDHQSRLVVLPALFLK